MVMNSNVSITIFGNVESGRTEAEVNRDGVCVAIVYEGADGWHIEHLEESQAQLCAKEIAMAQGNLEVYVNRQGVNPPPGLSAAGLSFWLMEKDDGTSMGAAVKDVPDAI
jgi:hypothetical protein